MNVVKARVLLQLNVRILADFITNLLVVSLGQNSRVLILNVLPLVDFAWVVSLDEPRIGAVVFVKIIFLLLLVQLNVVVVSVVDLLSVEATVLVILEFLLGHEWLVKRWCRYFLVSSLVCVVSSLSEVFTSVAPSIPSVVVVVATSLVAVVATSTPGSIFSTIGSLLGISLQRVWL